MARNIAFWIGQEATVAPFQFVQWGIQYITASSREQPDDLLSMANGANIL